MTWLVAREKMNSFLDLNHGMFLCAEIEAIYTNNIGYIVHVGAICISNMFKKKVK